MYGLILEAIVDVAKKKYGKAIWEKVRQKIKLDVAAFSTHQQYSETIILKMIKALSEIAEVDQNELMEEMGVEFVDFVGQFGYDRILRVLGRHMRDFLNGLDNLHEYMRFSYPKLKPPSFFVEKENADGLVLHYRSKRKGFLHYVKGQIKQVGKVFYNLDVKINVISDESDHEMTHVIFDLKFNNEHYNHHHSSASLTHRHSIVEDLKIRSDIFFELFPFHIVFKKTLEIVSIGDGLKQVLKHYEGEAVSDLFNLTRPLINFTWPNIISHTNNVFVMTTIEPIRRAISPTLIGDEEETIYATQTSTETRAENYLKLKGQMMFVKEWDSIIFLGTPVLENLDTMFTTGFYINDLSMHDSSRDLVLVGTQQSAELKLALDQEKQKSKAIEESMKKLDIEMKRTDQLLYQMIPKKIADRLRSGEQVMNLCEVVSSCTILFSDVVGFTSTCSMLTPMEVVSMLNSMYTKFDKSLEQHDVYKVETIGDAYMVVSGLPERTNNHAAEIIEMGFDMLIGISTLLNPATSKPLMIRVGCHSGPVVAGVVGLKMPRYCLFGDTVNTASRMESTSQAMKIHISESSKELLDHKFYRIVDKGTLEVKGKGLMKTYFVECKLDDKGNPIKLSYVDLYTDIPEAKKDTTKKVKDNSDFQVITPGAAPVSNPEPTKPRNSIQSNPQSSPFQPPPPSAPKPAKDENLSKVLKTNDAEKNNKKNEAIKEEAKPQKAANKKVSDEKSEQSLSNHKVQIEVKQASQVSANSSSQQTQQGDKAALKTIMCQIL